MKRPFLYTGLMAKWKKSWTRKKLLALGIPAVLIPGILTAIVLGWNPAKLLKPQNYYANQTLFPKAGEVAEAYDGDTFRLKSGAEVRLIGIDAPNRGEANWQEARGALERMTRKKRVYLEYDRYQDDKYGRVLAWIWIDCEKEPTFSPPDYMRLSYNQSRAGLMENPDGCYDGKLVNEELVKAGLATAERYKDRGPLKYEERVGGVK